MHACLWKIGGGGGGGGGGGRWSRCGGHWGSGESGQCEVCGSRGRSGWYLVIKGGDVGSQEEIGRKRVRLRLYWGVEVGGEEYIGNNVRETSMVQECNYYSLMHPLFL